MKLFLAWYDMWVGAYFDRKERLLFICLLPCVVLRIKLGRTLLEELRHCEETGRISQRLRKHYPKAHFCCAWDDMLIHEGCTEINYCSCFREECPF